MPLPNTPSCAYFSIWLVACLISTLLFFNSIWNNGIPLINNITSPLLSFKIGDFLLKIGCSAIWYLDWPAAISCLSYIFKLTSFPLCNISLGLSLIIPIVLPLIKLFNLTGYFNSFILSITCCISVSVKGKSDNLSCCLLFSNNIFAQLSNKSFSVGFFKIPSVQPFSWRDLTKSASNCNSSLYIIFLLPI